MWNENLDNGIYLVYIIALVSHTAKNGASDSCFSFVWFRLSETHSVTPAEKDQLMYKEYFLKWNKSGLMRGAHTWTPVSYWLVRNGKFT